MLDLLVVLDRLSQVISIVLFPVHSVCDLTILTVGDQAVQQLWNVVFKKCGSRFCFD